MTSKLAAGDVQHDVAPVNQAYPRVSRPRLTLVIPCHNEEQALPETCIRLSVLIDELNREALIAEPSIYFIDDGWTDNTWGVI